jgi:hypothetical protein
MGSWLDLGEVAGVLCCAVVWLVYQQRVMRALRGVGSRYARMSDGCTCVGVFAMCKNAAGACGFGTVC